MRQLLTLIVLCLCLAGCQNTALTELDYRHNTDFTLLRSWQWAAPDVEFIPNTSDVISDLDRARVREMVAEQLLQRGYMPSPDADFKVRARLILEERTERIHSSRSSAWGPFWGEPLWIDTQDIHLPIMRLQLDILDHQDESLIWRASDEWPATRSKTRPQQRDADIRNAARRLLQHFPPL